MNQLKNKNNKKKPKNIMMKKINIHNKINKTQKKNKQPLKITNNKRPKKLKNIPNLNQINNNYNNNIKLNNKPNKINKHKINLKLYKFQKRKILITQKILNKTPLKNIKHINQFTNKDHIHLIINQYINLNNHKLKIMKRNNHPITIIKKINKILVV